MLLSRHPKRMLFQTQGTDLTAERSEQAYRSLRPANEAIPFEPFPGVPR